MLNYKIIKIDNFFSNEDFIEISKYAKNLNNKNEFDIYHNQIDVQNNIIKSTIDNNFLIKINKKYFPIALNILKELYPEKVQFISYCDFTIVKTKKKIEVSYS